MRHALIAVLALLLPSTTWPPTSALAQAGAAGADAAPNGDSIAGRPLDLFGLDDAPSPWREEPGSLSPEEAARPASPDLVRDAALLTLGTTGYAVLRDKQRRGMFRRGSFANVLENFKHPIRRALDSRDNDSFLTNYVAHPLTWGGIALYLKSEGYSDLGALALSQAHSVYWEYVIEGSYVLPSGRDMVTNFVSVAFVIYGLPLVTGDLFPAASATPPETPGREPARLSLAPPVVAGPDGPRLQLGLQIR